MKKVNTKRFQQKNPENISFQGDSIPQKPLNTAKNTPLPSEEKKNERTNETISERTNERTVKKNTPDTIKPASDNNIVSGNFYTVEIPADRIKTRHSFDIFEDQKTALSKIQLATVDAGYKKKPVLGEMIQEAIDIFIKERSKKLNNLKIVRERTNERS